MSSVPDDAEKAVPVSEDQSLETPRPPDRLSREAWVGLLLFAAFVVGTSSCMISLLLG